MEPADELRMLREPIGSTWHASDWGRFVVEYYFSPDEHGNQHLSIRDARQADGVDPFWWFADSHKHPMRRQERA
jgi:hypothetical protein